MSDPDFLDYGEGKTRRQEEADSMWVLAYGCLALIVALLVGLGVVVWWVL